MRIYFVRRFPFVKIWRNLPLVPTEWHTSNQMVRAHFRQLLSDEETAKAFDPDFLKGITARRLEKSSLVNKLWVFNLTMTAVMAAWLFTENFKFSVLGLSVERTDQLIEFVRLVQAVVGLYGMMIIMEVRLAGSVLAELCAFRAPKAANYFRMSVATLGEGGIDIAPSPWPHVGRSTFLRIATRAWAFVLIAALVSFVAGTSAISVLVSWNMYESPALGPVVSRLMATFSLMCDLCGLGIFIFLLAPLPMSNYRDVVETQPILEKQGFDAWRVEMLQRIAQRKANRGNRT